jgi:antitoxin CptB
MREMDMLLGPFSDGPLSELSDAELDIYEQLLAENDQEIYRWISAQEQTPEQYQGLIRAVLLGAPSV